MSTQSDAIYTALNGDATLLTSLTGGVWKFAKTNSGDTNSIQRNGISKVSMASAFDSNGLLKPCAIIKARMTVPISPTAGGAYDHANHLKTVAETVMVYLFTDGDKEESPLMTAAERIEKLIDMQFVGSSWWNLVNIIDEDRDPDMNLAFYKRLDFRSTRNKYS